MKTTIVLAPGSKPGPMATKRWPFFAQLSEFFDDVVVVGTELDLAAFDGAPLKFPKQVRSLVGKLSLSQTAAVLAGAAVVVANDGGLGHLAGALGVPTILLFGPTPHRTLGMLPPNVAVMRSGLSCEPCWFARRFRACDARIDCLRHLSVKDVAFAVDQARKSRLLGPDRDPSQLI